jgi:Ca2+:H+ antiporter
MSTEARLGPKARGDSGATRGGGWLRHAVHLPYLFILVALYLDHFQPERPILIFFFACLGIIPAAAWIGRATEQIANRVGEGIGGLLTATFGNAAELIITIVALRAGQIEIVKASLAGAIMANSLLVLGDSFLAGGLRYKEQQFNPIPARAQAQMLLLVSIALIVPAIFHYARLPGMQVNEAAISLAIAALLMTLYVLSLVFSLRTHRDLMGSPHSAEAGEEHGEGHGGGHGEGPAWSMPVAVGALVAATIVIVLLSEMMVGSVEHAAEAVGMSKVFVGMIIVAIVGGAAEHIPAVLGAMKNRMDMSVGIALGSSTQIALFVTPFLVFLSYLIAPQPMDLVFTKGGIIAILISASLVAHITSAGRSNWFNGVLLQTLYLIMAVGFFFTPD